MAGSSGLGEYFSLTKVNLYLNWAYHFFASRIIGLWNVQVISLFPKPLGAQAETTNPLTVIFKLIADC